MKTKWILLVLAAVALCSFAEMDKEEMFGRLVYDKEERETRTDKLDADIYAVYFSAHWCKPCQAFTPKLVEFYNEVKDSGGKLEIIFVSSDRTEDAMFEYMEEAGMPWFAMEYKCSEAEALKKRFEVRGIPNLVVLDSDGNLIANGKDGRMAVQHSGIKAWSVWMKGERGAASSRQVVPSGKVTSSRGAGPAKVVNAASLLQPALKQKLNLSVEQRGRIAGIVKKTKTSWTEAKKNGADKEKLAAIRKDALSAALELLTEEQRGILDGKVASKKRELIDRGSVRSNFAGDTDKVDPQVVASARRAVPVVILCKTQLLNPPGGFEAFCAENKNRKRSGLRSQTIAKLKEIADSGEQDVVLKTIGNLKNTQRFWIVNAISATLTPEKIRAVSVLPEVKYIYEDSPMRPNSAGPRQVSEVIGPDKRTDFSTKNKDVPWNLKAIGAEMVWDKLNVTGEGVIVAILDSGVNYVHEDLRNNLWANPDEIPNNGKDDDGNGLIDDVYGYNFNADSCEVRATGPRQHGTWTSGIVAGDGSGGTLTGVAPRARLMILKGSGLNGVAKSFQYALDQGADVVNMSFSVPNLGNGRGLWRLMAEQTVAAGMVLVSGCGNFQQKVPIPVQIRIPEGIPCVIGAGGVDENGDVPPFCSLGPVEWGSVKFYEDYPMPDGLIKPDVCGFPGPRYPVLAATDKGYVDPNTRIQGNSFSSPHVTGVVALMLSAAPDLPAWKVKEILEETANDIGEKGKDTRTGAGLVQAYEAVLAAKETR